MNYLYVPVMNAQLCARPHTAAFVWQSFGLHRECVCACIFAIETKLPNDELWPVGVLAASKCMCSNYELELTVI